MKPFLLNRREFVERSAGLAAGFAAARKVCAGSEQNPPISGKNPMKPSDLPAGSAPPALPIPQFPSRLHAFIWRNWQLIPLGRMAKVVGCSPGHLLRMARAMGLSHQPKITSDQRRRSYLTVIKLNWHLLPYSQLLELLEWTPEKMAFTLREDDFLFVKLGNLKPACEPLRYLPSDENTRAKEQQIARIVAEIFPDGIGKLEEPLFGFVSELSSRPSHTARPEEGKSRFAPRFCYSYFALYGDPLLEKEADPSPDHYLERLAVAGVNGVWLQAVLYKLSPFPWKPALSEHYEERLKNLGTLVARARRRGISIFLYLNEPRAMPLSFFADYPRLKGVVEGDHAALCTSQPEVGKYLADSVESICRAVPELGGFFTISGSENLTNCWSHYGGAGCPRCGKRSPAEVIAELHSFIQEGIHKSRSQAELIAWDWGWQDAWVPAIIEKLPQTAGFMSVSEWGIPIRRGGVESSIGEYSISTPGPGGRAKSRWALARKRGLKTLAKIQAGNTWELSAVPYIPALANVAQQAIGIREAKVDGLMLGWTLGGYPSPNLEVVAEIGRNLEITATQAMEVVARRRFGSNIAGAIVKAWQAFSAAFSEFPFGGGLYSGPMQLGPSNLLWETPTGFPGTMVGFPYDDLDGWRAAYPVEVFISQIERMANGFDLSITELKGAVPGAGNLSAAENHAFAQELNVAESAAIHFRSAANQCRFIQARRGLKSATLETEALPFLQVLTETIDSELKLARRLYDIQRRDSRIGFEASNQYYYVPMGLAEKVLNCRDLRDRWLPAERRKWSKNSG